MKLEEFKRELISGFRDIMKGRRPVRYIHRSTGPGYVPRRSPIGSVRSPEQKGVTYNVGRNRQKRAKRWLARADLPF